MAYVAKPTINGLRNRKRQKNSEKFSAEIKKLTTQIVNLEK
jgi:hypothetical protein